jgi:hypothetical protein
VAEVARRFKAGVVLPFAGAAQTRGPFHLTMDTNDTIETARAFPDAVIVPLHGRTSVRTQRICARHSIRLDLARV